MRVFLDTHTFLWALDDDPRLSQTARTLIDAPDTDRLLSVASLWEIAIKYSIGKLIAPTPPAPTLLEQVRLNNITLLPIAPEEALAVSALPFHHKDPFDRLLVAQCLAQQLPLVSADAALDAYGISRIW